MEDLRASSLFVVVGVGVDRHRKEDSHLASVVEQDSDMSVEDPMGPVELVDWVVLPVDHCNRPVTEEPFAAAEVSKQWMDKGRAVDAVLPSVLVLVELETVAVAFRSHCPEVSSSSEAVAAAVETQAEEDIQHVDNPFQDYCTSFVHRSKDHTAVAFHCRLNRTGALASASADNLAEDDPLDAVDSLDTDLASVAVTVAAAVVVESNWEVEHCSVVEERHSISHRSIHRWNWRSLSLHSYSLLSSASLLVCLVVSRSRLRSVQD